MKDEAWSVIQCMGPEGELVWSVVHRQKPMFVAVVSDRSVDQLDEIPSGAIHWAKQETGSENGSLRREALETIRSCRSGELAIVGDVSRQRRPPGSIRTFPTRRRKLQRSDADSKE